MEIDEEAFQQMLRYLHRSEVTEEQARQVVLEYLGTDEDPLAEIAQDIYWGYLSAKKELDERRARYGNDTD